MEDGRGQQNILNLLHQNLPIPSWSSSPLPPASLVISSADASLCDGGGIFNYPAAHPVTMNNQTSYNLNMGAAPEMCPASQVDPAHSLLINSNLQMDHVGVVGGGVKRSRMKTTRTRSDGCMNNGQVIHVRAKRGQATDSHSLAERVRREKINDKLKALQHLVPGCYKTMGMAVMLGVIINYVQSLQNQIEFLSMKLSAASMFYDFNSPEAEAIEAFQRANSNPCEEEAREMERMMIIREDDQGFDPLHLTSSSASASARAHLHPTCPF